MRIFRGTILYQVRDGKTPPADGAKEMNEHAYQKWQILHRRIVSGEMLNTREQTDYEAGCRDLDAGESLDGNLDRLRELRAQIAEAGTEQQRLQTRERELDARITELEARLDTRTRQLLGIGN